MATGQHKYPNTPHRMIDQPIHNKQKVPEFSSGHQVHNTTNIQQSSETKTPLTPVDERPSHDDLSPVVALAIEPLPPLLQPVLERLPVDRRANHGALARAAGTRVGRNVRHARRHDGSLSFPSTCTGRVRRLRTPSATFRTGVR